MSSSALFSLGTRAMAASYAALQTTSHNIANANTRGYSRQQVELATSGGQFSGEGFFGKGVDVSTVSRAHDEYLTREVALSRSIAEADGARLSQLQRLEGVFGTGESGLGYIGSQLLNAFADLASRPQDASARQVVLARAEDVASRYRAAGEQISAIQAGVVQDLKSSVKAVNALAQTVASLNKQIAIAQGAGHAPNDLLDQRDLAIADLGAYVNVTAIAGSDGSLNLFIGGGQRLVLGSQASELAVVADPYDPSRAGIGLRDGGPDRMLAESVLGGGSMAGLLRFQNNDLRDARNVIGQLAAALGGAVNAQQRLGLDMTTPTGRPGGDLFAIGAPRALAASSNLGSASLSLQAADASQLRASEYELRFDGVNYSLTRLGSTDAPQTFSPATLAAGVTVDGLSIRLAGGTPAVGDRFLLQPVAAAASGMQRVLQDPRGIAAASPITATLGTGNVGTLAVTSITVRAPVASPQNVLVRFDVDPATGVTSYRFSVDAGGSFSPAQPLVAGQPIAYTDASGTLLWDMAVGGTPADGDQVLVDPTTAPASSNGNALAMLDLRDAALVGGDSITDAWAGALSDIGVRVQGAKGAADLSSAVASDAAARRSATAGVNLDEEAARLLQYQQSYQAAAKMLQVAQSVFDTLLQSANG